jgi:16S rRNA (adenine1518-N6/adenine1519-N6)-dimethyltransferase
MVSVEQLHSVGIDDGLRPENLSLADYVAIADLLADESLAAQKSDADTPDN